MGEQSISYIAENGKAFAELLMKKSQIAKKSETTNKKREYDKSKRRILLNSTGFLRSFMRTGHSAHSRKSDSRK